MNRYFTGVAAAVWLSAGAVSGATGVIQSVRSENGPAIVADPESPFWKYAPGVFAENDSFGRPVPGLRTEVRSRWTASDLYLLFICPYQQLYMNSKPSTTSETNKLWEHDVAETFIGGDFQNIRKYKEFQVSPAGEWVDLDIDRDHPLPQGGWQWNSGFTVAARVDEQAHVWYGAMKIPLTAIKASPALPGDELRINFYRFQGPPPDRRKVAWLATGSESFHVPEAFGRLVFK